ncbi:hypothetical protein [Streptomyces sp. NPDC059349]|uniref:hypothetical protein n=1 Tax=Streptomyces sp. NPDC059349 TaxID=3346808 RepID=UPI003678E19A
MITIAGVPMEERLSVLTLGETHDVLDVLAHVATGDDEDWAWEARTLLSNLAARVPSRESP